MMPERTQMPQPPSVWRLVEDIVGCKWSLVVLAALRAGVCRPGAPEHTIEGLSKKVLNEGLGKLVRIGILDPRIHAVVSPRVGYRYTAFGVSRCLTLHQRGHSAHSRSGCCMRPAACSAASPLPQK